MNKEEFLEKWHNNTSGHDGDACECEADLTALLAEEGEKGYFEGLQRAKEHIQEIRREKAGGEKA